MTSATASVRTDRSQTCNQPGGHAGEQDRDQVLATEYAWRLVSAHEAAIAKVDAKASFAFAVESAIGAAAATVLPAEGGLARWLLACGLTLIAAGVVSAVAAVFPALHVHQHRQARAVPQNFLYFGSLRLWTADDLVGRLRAGDLVTPAAEQAVTLAQLAWTKHRRLQLSLLFAAAGAAPLTVALWLAVL